MSAARLLEKMAVDDAEQAQDAAFRALAHPVRRCVLDLLRERPRTTGEISERFEMSRFGVMKHLTVLVDAGLVVVTRRGRERWNHLNAVPLAAIQRRFVSRLAQGAATRLETLRRSAEGGMEMSESNETAFGVAEVVSEIRMAASAERVWEAITTGIGGWWPAGFLSSPNAKRMVMEPRLGGRVYETWTDDGGDEAGLLWYVVTGIDVGRELRLSGELTPDWGGPARLSTRWTLTPDGDGTMVRLEEVVSGRMSADTPKNMTDGWKMLLDDHLRPHVEG